MATMPAFLTRTPARREHPRPQAEFGDAQRAVRDAFLLRPLPQEDVYFHCKTIDNSRLVREPDPRLAARPGPRSEPRRCWPAS